MFSSNRGDVFISNSKYMQPIRGTQSCFFDVNETNVNIFGLYSKDLNKLLERENEVCTAMARKKQHWVFFNVHTFISRDLSSRVLACAFPGDMRKKMPQWFVFLFCLPFCIWR